MAEFPWGSLIGAGANLAAGFLGQEAAGKARDEAGNQAEMNRRMQMQFAQEGIRWRVADAKAAGLHPLAALGMQPASFAPISISGSGDTSLAAGLSAAGQDISRGINSMKQQDEKLEAYTTAARALQLENSGLQNEVLRSQLRRMNAPGSPPGLPASRGYLMPGQGNSTVLDPLNLIRGGLTPSTQSDSTMPDVGYSQTTDGEYPVPGKDVKERIEDNFYHETMHFIRNNVLPTFGLNWSPPRMQLRPGHVWEYDPMFGYKQVPVKHMPSDAAKGSWFDPRNNRLNRWFNK